MDKDSLRIGFLIKSAKLLPHDFLAIDRYRYRNRNQRTSSVVTVARSLWGRRRGNGGGVTRTEAKDAVVNFMQDHGFFFYFPFSANSKSTLQFPLGFFCNVKMSLAIMLKYARADGHPAALDKTINLSHKLNAKIKSYMCFIFW